MNGVKAATVIKEARSTLDPVPLPTSFRNMGCATSKLLAGSEAPIGATGISALNGSTADGSAAEPGGSNFPAKPSLQEAQMHGVHATMVSTPLEAASSAGAVASTAEEQATGKGAGGAATAEGPAMRCTPAPADATVAGPSSKRVERAGLFCAHTIDGESCKRIAMLGMQGDMFRAVQWTSILPGN